MKLVVVIPGYQNHRTVAGVVRGAQAHGFPVWVVDDGCTDASGANAEAAGRANLPHFRAALDVEDKGGAKGYDPVTVSDHAAEAIISAEIARAYPDHGIRGEEH